MHNDPLIRATIEVEGHAVQELSGRWADASFQLGSHVIRVHANPDGSGFLMRLIGGRQTGLVSWESLLALAAAAAAAAAINGPTGM